MSVTTFHKRSLIRLQQKSPRTEVEIRGLAHTVPLKTTILGVIAKCVGYLWGDRRTADNDMSDLRIVIEQEACYSTDVNDLHSYYCRI